MSLFKCQEIIIVILIKTKRKVLFHVENGKPGGLVLRQLGNHDPDNECLKFREEQLPKGNLLCGSGNSDQDSVST